MATSGEYVAPIRTWEGSHDYLGGRKTTTGLGKAGTVDQGRKNRVKKLQTGEGGIEGEDGRKGGPSTKKSDVRL